MISLLGSLLGFGTSFLPSLLDLFKQKQSDKQAILLLEAKSKYAEQMSKYKIQELDAEADIAEAKAIYAHAEELAKNNTSPFIGALQASVRPVITYLLFSVFAFVKVTQVIMAVQGGGDVLQGVVAAWDLETQAMFSAVIAFWFGNRMMKSAKK